MSVLQSENEYLKKQVESLQRSSKDKDNSLAEKLHHLRQDGEKTFKERQVQWKTTTDNLKQQQEA